MVRFVHTSDWQLGMTRHFLEGEAQARYTGARIDAIRTIGSLARAQRCDFVVVAGDVFESNLVASQTVRRSLEAMAAIELPVYLLPGNHDPLDAVTIFRSRLFERLVPDNVHVLADAGVHEIAAGVELVAAPWRSKAPLADLVGEAVRSLAPAPEGTVRIVVGHGALDVLKPDEHDPAVIELAPLERALDDGVVHYAALGDKHTRLAMGRRRLINYSGSPEVTSFREELPGDVLVVDVQPTGQVRVEPHHVGSWQFLTMERVVSSDGDLDELDAELGALDPKDRTVVRTGLQGTLTLAQKARLDALLDAYAEVLAGCFTRDRGHGIAVVVGDEELTDLGVGGFVDAAAADLAMMARLGGTDGTADAEVAREALSLLYRLAKGPAA